MKRVNRDDCSIGIFGKSGARCALGLLVLLAGAGAAFGWGTKEHIQLTRMAGERLLADAGAPEAMKRWLRDAVPDRLDTAGEEQYFLTARAGPIPRGVSGIPFWATMPDVDALTEPRDRKVEPFGVHARTLHFLDVELFMPDETRRSYADDLSHKPSLADFPRNLSDPRYQQAGMLPFRIEQCYQKLVSEIREGRLIDTPGRYPRDDHASYWAGYLAHYLEDNTQPHHATLDYKSQSYFADPLRAPDVHAELEFRLNDDPLDDFPALRREFWPLFAEALNSVKDPSDTDDPWKSTLEVSLHSYDALPLIGAAARAAAGGTHGKSLDTAAFFHFKGRCFGAEMSVMQMKARQLALAVVRVERVWSAAWRDAEASGVRPPR